MSFQSEALDFLKDVILILAIVLIVRTFFIMPFQINGASMMDSYYDKQFIIVDRLSYREIPLVGQLQEIERGDVIIFTPGVSRERKYFIKRVIGVPGDEIRIADGIVSVKAQGEENFRELPESAYLSDNNFENTTVSGDRSETNYIVPENRYFALGDNRTQSTDSRTCFGNCNARTEFISPEEIVGKVFIDLGYFNFRDFSFSHPNLDVSTKPTFFSSPAEYSY